MGIQPPPNFELALDEGGKFRMAWKLFFQQLFNGDNGTAWSPTFTNLTVVGTPTITGMYFKLGQFAIAEITITPSTSTTAVAGTTYCDFPLIMQANGICFAVADNTGSNSGMCTASVNRIYVPAWTGVTTPVTIFALVRAN